jgi:hypothetical protein
MARFLHVRLDGVRGYRRGSADEALQPHHGGKMNKLCLIVILLSSCAHRAKLEPKIRAGIGWRAVETKEGFVVTVESNEAQADAMKWLCGKEYICATKPIGQMLSIERTAK